MLQYLYEYNIVVNLLYRYTIIVNHMLSSHANCRQFVEKNTAPCLLVTFVDFVMWPKFTFSSNQWPNHLISNFTLVQPLAQRTQRNVQGAISTKSIFCPHLSTIVYICWSPIGSQSTKVYKCPQLSTNFYKCLYFVHKVHILSTNSEPLIG